MTEKKGQGDLTKAGDVPMMKALTRKLAPPTRAQEKLTDAAVAIRQAPDASEAAFLARQLVQCTLPHTDPGNVEAWQRTNGNLTLVIQAGWDTEKKSSLGYPYGTVPRLLLFWIVTEVLRTGERRLGLGHHLADFMRKVGLDPSRGGPRSDRYRLQKQMARLFASRISFHQTIDEPHRHGKRWLNMEVAPQGEFWWDPKHPEQGTLWGSWIELGESFFNAIQLSPVPVDVRALRALKRSPLALDVYAWAAYKVFTVSRKGRPQFVTWRELEKQFGAEYDPKRIDHFKEKVKAALRKVQAVFPGMNVSKDRYGVTIHVGGKPAIKPRPPTAKDFAKLAQRLREDGKE